MANACSGRFGSSDSTAVAAAGDPDYHRAAADSGGSKGAAADWTHYPEYFPQFGPAGRSRDRRAAPVGFGLGWLGLADCRRFYTTAKCRSTACQRRRDSYSTAPEFANPSSTLTACGESATRRHANGPGSFPNPSPFKHTHPKQHCYPHQSNSDGNLNCGRRRYFNRDCSSPHADPYSGADAYSYSATPADQHRNCHLHLDPAAADLHPNSSPADGHAD